MKQDLPDTICGDLLRIVMVISIFGLRRVTEGQRTLQSIRKPEKSKHHHDPKQIAADRVRQILFHGNPNWRSVL